MGGRREMEPGVEGAPNRRDGRGGGWGGWMIIIILIIRSTYYKVHCRPILPSISENTELLFATLIT
jgi:hypothetical protein